MTEPALGEAEPVAQRADLEHAASPPSSRPMAPPPRPLWKVLIPILALVGVGVTVVVLLWRQDERLIVAAHSWSRSVEVERIAAVRQSAWCDELPAGASQISRRREQRGTARVPDGEDCQTQGLLCSPRFRDEAVYDEKCDYTIATWRPAREVRANGQRQDEPPRWPTVTLHRPGCGAVGCEREGARRETYTVVFRAAGGGEYRCRFDERTWAKYTDGKRYTGQLRALVGSLDCATLRGPR